MRLSLRNALRLVVVASLLAPVVPLVVSGIAPADTPYLSALSNLVVSQAMAAPPCPNKRCERLGHGHCKKYTGTTCQANPDTTCSSTYC